MQDRFRSMPRAVAALLVAASCAALLAGCESMSMSIGKKIDYKSAGSAPALEIPPDMTTPTYDDRYQSATASGAAAAAVVAKPTEILPVNGDARVARGGTESWLVVKATQEQAWNTLKEFWTANGFVIASEQPNLGIMETDWAENRAAVPQDFLQQYTSKYLSFLNDTYKRDKFRSRIERGTEPGTVEIFISHRGAAQLPARIKEGAGEDYQWRETPPDPALEAEFLARLMIAFGATPAQAQQQVAAAMTSPDRARMEKNSDGSDRLVVDDAFDRAWRRVGLALDRTGFTVVDRDRSQGLYYVRYSDPDLVKKQNDGLFADFFAKLQFWKSDSPAKPEQYRVVVTQSDPRSVVTVQDPGGAPDKTATGEKILALLKDQLK
jgi:outer membrane protein assembly factor BamC